MKNKVINISFMEIINLMKNFSLILKLIFQFLFLKKNLYILQIRLGKYLNKLEIL